MASVRSRRCVVIGAGVLGASVAARLASAGLQVTLLEADQPGRATSRWSFAWLNSNDKAPRPYHDLNHAGIRAWADLAPDLDGAAWYRPVGHLELATSDAGRAELQARVSRLTEWGYPAQLIDPAEACELEPALRFPESGGTVAWFPGEGYVLTEPLIARLVGRAAACGAEILTGEQGRVTGLDPGPGGGRTVRTTAGAVLAADQVVCCAGRWVPELATMGGAAGPVPLVAWGTPGATAPGLAVRVGPLASAGPVRVVHTPEIALRPHSRGLLHLEAPDATVDLHTPEPELRLWATALLRRAQQTVRGLTGARVEQFQVCVRPMPADGQSIVGPLPGAPGLYIAVTHSGVTLAAHLSRLIAAELTTGTAPAELAPYRPARFLASPLPPPLASSPAPYRLARFLASPLPPPLASSPAPQPPPTRPAPLAPSSRALKFNERGVLPERITRTPRSLVSLGGAPESKLGQSGHRAAVNQPRGLRTRAPNLRGPARP